MTSVEFDFYVVDTILQFISQHGVCEVDFDMVKIQREARADYQTLMHDGSEDNLKNSIEKFNATYSEWSDKISTEIANQGHATIDGSQVAITEQTLSDNANQFLYRFIMAILQAKFGHKLTVL